MNTAGYYMKLMTGRNVRSNNEAICEAVRLSYNPRIRNGPMTWSLTSSSSWSLELAIEEEYVGVIQTVPTTTWALFY